MASSWWSPARASAVVVRNASNCRPDWATPATDLANRPSCRAVSSCACAGSAVYMRIQIIDPHLLFTVELVRDLLQPRVGPDRPPQPLVHGGSELGIALAERGEFGLAAHHPLGGLPQLRQEDRPGI